MSKLIANLQVAIIHYLQVILMMQLLNLVKGLLLHSNLAHRNHAENVTSASEICTLIKNSLLIELQIMLVVAYSNKTGIKAEISMSKCCK